MQNIKAFKDSVYVLLMGEPDYVAELTQKRIAQFEKELAAIPPAHRTREVYIALCDAYVMGKRIKDDQFNIAMMNPRGINGLDIGFYKAKKYLEDAHLKFERLFGQRGFLPSTDGFDFLSSEVEDRRAEDRRRDLDA